MYNQLLNEPHTIYDGGHDMGKAMYVQGNCPQGTINFGQVSCKAYSGSDVTIKECLISGALFDAFNHH